MSQPSRLNLTCLSSGSRSPMCTSTRGDSPRPSMPSRQAIQLSTMPQPLRLVKLAQLYLEMQQPKLPWRHSIERCAALPLTSSPQPEDAASIPCGSGSCGRLEVLGDMKQAASFDEEAVQLAPESADAWSHLAKLYQRQGQFENQYRAEERAAKLAKPPGQ